MAHRATWEDRARPSVPWMIVVGAVMLTAITGGLIGAAFLLDG